MSDASPTTEVPKWLEKLEKLREQRVQRRLGHETGAGAPCLNCVDKCPGLDLHFWRKICKVCKCSKDSHNVENDDSVSGWVQFQLLGTKPVKTKGILLPSRKDKMNLEWTPLGASEVVEKYLDQLPTDILPISGSDAARKRQQCLQNQIPAHDIDATLCDGLTPEEMKQMDEYISHIRQFCVGQGKLIELARLQSGGNRHQIGQSDARLVTNQLQSQMASCENVPFTPSAFASDLANLTIRDKNNTLDDQLDPLVNNIQCYECNNILAKGTMAISIEKSSSQWHPECFKCHECHELLADFLYFYHKPSGHIYCLRDYAKIKGIPRCVACDELIFSREHCVAENNIYHIKHFCCWDCDTPLANKKYILDEDDKPLCLPCFESLVAAKCNDCGQVIGADQQGANFEGLHWHTPQCFVCKQCRKHLLGEKFLFRHRNIFCSAKCASSSTG